MILSIDVGIKNLAMCLMDSKMIIQWEVAGIPPEHADGIFVSLRRHLDDRPWVLEADTILIEKQPDRNKRIKMVEHFLHAYFVIKNPYAETIIYDARHKIPDVAGPGRAQYLKRKSTSIVRCEAFIHEHNPTWVEHFKASKKKDDLADTVMQALSFKRAEAPVAKKEKTLTARKPTENQKKTKYSKSNLLWLYKNNTYQTDKRFVKDMKRYYKDMDEFISDV